MNTLFIIATIGFFIWTIRNVFFWVSLWQTKEYRLDRLAVHMRETIQGRRLITSPISWIKWALLLAFLAIIFQDTLTYPYQIAITSIYIYEAVTVLIELRGYHQFKRPARTAKAYCIVLLTLIFITTLYFLPMLDMFVWLLILDRITLLLIGLFVFFFSFPTEIYTDIQIQHAKKKMAKMKKLTVIAVSGSYGKSSTKEYIAQVLADSFTVVKTIGSNNTPIGIAKTILTRVTNKTEIFVVEMGAYKRGEIAELCDIVTPHISVTTSVSDQHLSLYGSLRNAIETEKELIDALPKSGIALFNGNNTHTRELFKRCKKNKVVYTTEIDKRKNEREKGSSIVASRISVQKDSVSFDVSIDGNKTSYKASLLGGHMIENLLPAIYIAKHLGVSTTTIKKALISITPPPKTMIKKELPTGIDAVDDTFNVSPESIQAALQYMRLYKKKKILVLMPMIELGKHAKSRHEDIGKVIGAICDHIFLTNKNYYADIKRGIDLSKGDCVIQTGTPDVIAREVKAIAQKGDIVLFEGKEAGIVLEKLKNQK